MDIFDARELDENLQYAITMNDLEMVKEILEMDINLELRNERGDNALHVAAAYGNPDIVQLILEKGVDINSLSLEDHRTPLHLAVSNDRLHAAQILMKNNANLNVQDDSGDTALHIAAYLESITMTNILLKYGADPNIRNEEKDSPFHLILNSNSYSWYLCDVHEFNELFYVYLNYNLDVNLKNRFGENALHLASMLASAKVVRRLLKMNVDVNERSDDGSVPLHYAAKNSCGTDGRMIAKLLIKFGADINVCDECNQTPFIISIKEGHCEVTKYLINQSSFDSETYGYDPLYLAIEAKSYFIINLLSKHGYRADSAKYGILAAKGGHIETMDALLTNGMKIDAADFEQGLSILTAGIYSDNEYNRYIVEFLLKKEADVNYEINGWVPLSRVWEDPPRNLIVLNTLLKHVTLLVAQNKFVHEVHLKMIKGNYELRRKFYLYSLELSRMKHTYIWESIPPVSYFDLLVLRNGALMKHLRSKEVRLSFESCRYKKICKEYRDELEGNVDEGIHRFQAVRMWENLLHKIFGHILPFEITCTIAAYMLHFFRYTRYVNYGGIYGAHTCVRY